MDRFQPGLPGCRRAGAAEEVLLTALRESRRNLLGLQAARDALDDSIKREEMQARVMSESSLATWQGKASTGCRQA